ncbi:hypothetical protein KGP17_15190 [Serratia sp. JSRIV001]|uniref:hypothetical protein n=1 Tax=Serratia sp. JSRIV001 TaxID=2831893 RepID=UPI001CC0FD71|nr:hypothetical protein [Serratia sp. JSRIV001]UAN43835.1 hypothetical protein KGP17_15190 [Serratia sp. JSRIV001]
MLPLVIIGGIDVRKTIFLSLLSLAFTGCGSNYPSGQYEQRTEQELAEKTTYKIIEIPSEGDFSGVPINGVKLRNELAKRNKRGESSEYIVHSVTYAPYNNTWSKKGWLAGTDAFKKGTYNVREYLEVNAGEAGAIRNAVGWYGFPVDKHVTTNHDTYEGANAFGVTAQVERLRYKGAILVFGNNGINPDSRIPVDADIEVIGDLPINLSHRDCKIEYLARVKALGHGVVSGMGDKSPTLDSPDDIRGDVVVFNADLIAARLVNTKTGEVYPAKLRWVFREI